MPDAAAGGAGVHQLWLWRRLASRFVLTWERGNEWLSSRVCVSSIWTYVRLGRIRF